MNYRIVCENKVFTSLEEFARNIYLYPDASEKILTSTKFLSLLASEDKEKFNKLIEVNHNIKDVEAFLFHAQYILCPHMELRHHGYLFTNLEDLGKKILTFGPTIDIYLKDFLKYKFLTKYMVDQGLDILNPIMFSEIKELENAYKENENKVYFLLGFKLAKCDTIVYEKERFYDVKTFLSRMIYKKNISKFSKELEKSQYVYAWLEIKGYGNLVNNYRSLVETIEQLELEVYERNN